MRSIILMLTLFIYAPVLLQAQEGMLWKFQTRESIHASPLVAEDLIYVGSADSTLYAVDKKTGKNVWQYKTAGAVHSSPLSIGNKVCFSSTDGRLYALDKESGTLLWKTSPKEEKVYDTWDYFLSSPKTDGNTIFWGSGDGHMYAIEAEDGSEKWSFATKGIIHRAPVFYADKVYFGSFDGHLYALHRGTGELAWKFRTVGATYFPLGEVQGSAMVHEGTLYFGSRDYNIYALDAESGRGKWNKKMPSWVIATPLAYKDKLYFGISDQYNFYSMNPANGKELWKESLNMRIFSAATGHEERVYFGCLNGKLYGLHHESGTIEWEFQTEGSQEHYDIVYDENGSFRKSFLDTYNNDMHKGEEIIQSLGAILSAPVVEEQTLYFGSSDGRLYAVGL